MFVMCYTSVPYTQHAFIMQHKYIKIMYQKKKKTLKLLTPLF